MKCLKVKMGEYNWLKCVLEHEHKGPCNFVVDFKRPPHSAPKNMAPVKGDTAVGPSTDTL